ncbi:hypothetical protein [Lacinutrix sp.]|uniref:hypothetical protein n=1 Tax=Lacinutrix sp. TaxID=1937692 RepID=UPI0025BD9AB7|nr:hypothetical protein [Lacinutrix sp.]
MRQIITLPFCNLEINNQIVIATINEGIHLTLDMSEEIILAVFNSLGDKPTIYITNRVNSYSVDPTLYSSLIKVKNIKGFGIVIHENNTSKSVEVESLFYKNKFEYFNSIKDAKLWGNKRLANSLAS